ncbi:MAG: hypothetical protein HQL69_21980 [Magnetococcales bacterium]|nr:hypothetical protein [Magnetococcales bacterium]
MRDADKEILLSMVGIVIIEEGYWYEIDSKAVAVTPARPHGLKYALTLHDPNGYACIA